jgi:hypothetical protein
MPPTGRLEHASGFFFRVFRVFRGPSSLAEHDDEDE